MKCYQCSAKVDPNADNCPRCGTVLRCTQELLDKAKQNNQDALTTLYHIAYRSVSYTVRGFIKDEDAVLDVIQNSYIKAFKRLHLLKDASNYKGWIKTIARNTAIDYLRQRKPLLFSEITSLNSEELLSLTDDRSDNLPDVVIDRRETARLMREILREIPEEQRLVIMMYYYEELSVGQIAEELALSQGTVKSRLNYGRKKIEAAVRRLAEQGTKLYGLAPIPFTRLVFRNVRETPVKAPRKVLKKVLDALNSDSSSGWGVPVGASTAENAGKTTSALTFLPTSKQPFIAKIAAGVLIAVCVTGTAAGSFLSEPTDLPYSRSATAKPPSPVNSLGNRSAEFIDPDVSRAPSGAPMGFVQQDRGNQAPANNAAAPSPSENRASAPDAPQGTTAPTTPQAPSPPSEPSPTSALQAPTQAPEERTPSPTVAPVDNPLDEYIGFFRSTRITSDVYNDPLGHFTIELPETWQSGNVVVIEEVMQDEEFGTYAQIAFRYRVDNRNYSEVFTLFLVSADRPINRTAYGELTYNKTFRVYRIPRGLKPELSSIKYEDLSTDDKAKYNRFYCTTGTVIRSFKLT